ncbi:complex I NDUFA9 subunit family protein [Marinibaculum pumilum]|uniref:Complex I NDUFA9 subunit family protein n=1 Tax=Marinibaculum pumilum TaxID=1766165 RepID=A0ABV7KW57_9PROT
MRGDIVTLFGGTGFLGRRIAAALMRQEIRVRIAARRPERFEPPPGQSSFLQRVQADLRDRESVRAAVVGSTAVANAVGLYVEGGDARFRDIHVDGARRVAEAVRDARATRLLHVSGIGADSGARDSYIRCRGEGERAVREAFPDAAILRPSVMFGDGDAFLGMLVQLVRRLPVMPLFGHGRCRLQPVHVDDVARAACRLLSRAAPPEPLYEVAGPRAWHYRDIVRLVAQASGRRRLLLPLPFPLWEALAATGRLLPTPPVTPAQVALMRQDNLPSADLPGLAALGIRPARLEVALGRLLAPEQPGHAGR